MGLSRRFLNLIVDHESAARSLRRIDLERLQLFSPRQEPALAPIRCPPTMDSIQLPSSFLRFEAYAYRGAGERWDLACYPFGHRKVLSTDQAGRNFLGDTSTGDVALMPSFHKPKLHRCLSLFVPASASGDGEDDQREGGGAGAGSLYVMVRDLREVHKFNIAAGQPSMDFEVLFYGNGRRTSHCQLLPLPPFALEPILPNERPVIRSYAVVGGGSHICVSVDGRGTYTLDTVSHTWDKVSDWTLPFHGKVEYVPELKLWFGLSDVDNAQLHLAAADLSTMDGHSPPRLAAGLSWEELSLEEWSEQVPDEIIDQEDVQLVNLGSGRFCIARFFMHCLGTNDGAFYSAVLTGVEVVPSFLANGEVKLEMIPHKSMCHHRSHARIEQFF